MVTVPVPKKIFTLDEQGDSLSKRIRFGGNAPGERMSEYIDRWVDRYVIELGYDDVGILSYFRRESDWYKQEWTI
jgi:hypothetical protein